MHGLSSYFFIRIGILGHVGRFRSVRGEKFDRGAQVICRTHRGLETGVVLAAASLPTTDSVEQAHMPDGTVLRRQTEADRMLLARLEKNRQHAFDACVDLLKKNDLSATLVDVEHLFDGRSLYFYFLGGVSPAVDGLTQQLADAYDSEVQFRAFADVVDAGCGPDCGTSPDGDCGTGCASCAAAPACS